jgi:polyphenol oxidase
VIGRHDTSGGAHFAFTDRWGGVSAAPRATLNLGGAVGDDAAAVRTNRERAAAALGIEPGRVVWMNQVHGRAVAVVEEPWHHTAGPAPAVDGVVSARRGLVLAVLTADCTPVLLADPEAGVVGAAHAGRPGLVAGVVPETVAAMTRLGADPARVTARTGPSVCGRCYEVPDELRAEVTAAVPEARAVTRRGTPAVDVAAGVRAQLAQAGVTTLEQSAVCTLESEDHFSYRREGATGRLGSYVWLED